MVGGLQDSYHVVIVGDFNSHLSNQGLSASEVRLIGKYAGHENFNSNGQQMRMFLGLYSFAVRSTQGIANQGFRWTWTNNRITSQVDHILTHTGSRLFLRSLQCTMPKTVSTDHKVLLCNIVDNRKPSHQQRGKRSHQPQMRVDPAPLRNDIVKKKYREKLIEQPCSAEPSCSVDDQWAELHSKVHNAAEAVLHKPLHYFMNKECRKALARVKKYSFWASRSPNPKWGYKLLEAKEALKRAQRDYEEKEVEDFFKDLHKYPAGERINRTFKYLKRYKKRNTTGRRVSSIRLTDWLVNEVDTPRIPDLLPEPADEDLLAGPTLNEIGEIVTRMKNGKVPGVDGLYAEFFKYCDEQTIEELHQLILKIWERNELPEEWKQVVVVPIPKVKNPKTVGDYRRICLSCTGYKIYASWILEKLQNIIGPLGAHQAAFLTGRSTTDHLYILQRILQEYWNEGTPLVLMSLDIEKAFDHVSLESLPAVLRGNIILSYFRLPTELIETFM